MNQDTKDLLYIANYYSISNSVTVDNYGFIFRYFLINDASYICVVSVDHLSRMDSVQYHPNRGKFGITNLLDAFGEYQ